MQKPQSTLTVILKFVISGLISVILTASKGKTKHTKKCLSKCMLSIDVER